MSADTALRTAERHQDQAAADRAAVRAGLATPAQRYRDGIRQGTRRPWTERQRAAAVACLEQFTDGEPTGSPFWSTVAALRDMDITSLGMAPWVGAVCDAWDRTDRYGRCYPRLRAWAERVLDETGGAP